MIQNPKFLTVLPRFAVPTSICFLGNTSLTKNTPPPSTNKYILDPQKETAC